MLPMRRLMLAGLAMLVLALVGPRPATAASEQQELVEKARFTFERMIADPEFTELKNYVKNARALLIYPTLVKGGFIIGGEGGTGVLVVRDDKLGWSYPAFYTLAAGSIGLQIGGQISEAIFVIMSSKALDAVLDNQMKFGGDVSVAVGPIGRGLGADTTTNLKADVYSFANAQGLFGGVSFEGAGILKRDSWNEAYYAAGATPYSIVIERKHTNINAQGLRNSLGDY
jgi:lipid-binding SYLF domain-containing protein